MNSNTLQDYCILLVENNLNNIFPDNFTCICTCRCSSLLEARIALDESAERFSALFLAEVSDDKSVEPFIEWLNISYPELPIVLVTESADNKALAGYLKSGVVAFLEYPVTEDVICNTVNNILSTITKNDSDKGEINAEFFTNDWVELSASSEIEYLSRIQRFSEVILKKYLNESIVDDIKLAMEEYGRNAIEWGNKFNIKKKFKISYCLFEDRIVLKFEDEGEGFDIKKLPDPTLDPVKHLQDREDAGKRPGGYGIYMMNNIMDEVFYNAKGNVCVMTKFF